MTPRLLDPSDPADRAAWQALSEASPAPSPFSALAFGEAVRSALGVPYALLAVEDETGLAAGVLAFYRRRGPLRVGVVPPFAFYTPVVLRRPLREADIHSGRDPLSALLDLVGDRFSASALHLPPDAGDVRPALWRGWQARPFYTYHLALAEGAKAWSRGTRSLFRRHGAEYQVEEDASDARAVAHLCQRSYLRHGRHGPVDARRMAALLATMAVQREARIFTARPASHDEPQAAVALLTAGETAYYWVAGSTPGPAMTALLGKVLPRLQEEGITRFDFVGANTPSIAEFKRRFGPELVPYFRIERIGAPLLRPVRRWLF